MSDATRAAIDRLRRVHEWIFLDGPRLVLATGVLALAFVVLSVPPVRGGLASWSSASMTTLFGSLVSGNLTVITVVVSINQLVLSRELRTPREMREEMDATVTYRDDVGRETDERVTPEDLTHFLFLILEAMSEHVETVEREARDIEDTEIRRNALALARAFAWKIDEMTALLEESDVELFTALSTILRDDFAAEFNRARHMGDVREDAMSDESLRALTEIQDRIRQLETARQYVKTLYMVTELSRLSRVLLYVGFLSVGSGVVTLALSGAPGAVSGIGLRLAIVIGLAPLAVLLAFVIRIATVAQRTAAIIPFGRPT